MPDFESSLYLEDIERKTPIIDHMKIAPTEQGAAPLSSHNNVNEPTTYLLKIILHAKCFWQVIFTTYQVAFRNHAINCLPLEVLKLQLALVEEAAGQEVSSHRMSFLHIRGLQLEGYVCNANFKCHPHALVICLVTLVADRGMIPHHSQAR